MLKDLFHVDVIPFRAKPRHELTQLTTKDLELQADEILNRPKLTQFERDRKLIETHKELVERRLKAAGEQKTATQKQIDEDSITLRALNTVLSTLDRGMQLNARINMSGLGESDG